MKERNLGMFKAYDIRSKREMVDVDLEVRLVKAVGLYLRDSVRVSGVVICRDARLYGPELMELALELFPRFGLDVYVNPLQTATCEFYFTCMRYPHCAGVMMTASHNPGNYVGLKLVAPGLVPIAFGYGPDGGIAKIQELYLQDAPLPAGPARGKVHIVNESSRFVDYSMRLANVGQDDLKGLHVMGEFLSGMAGVDVAMAFEKAGANFQSRHLVPDGFFPEGDPNPVVESSIAPARIAVKAGRYDFGFCFDGDGDRMDLMDGNGEQIVPGFNMAILVPEMKKLFSHAFPGQERDLQFYADVKAIPTALVEIAKAGVGVHIIRNGHSFIKGKLMERFGERYVAAEEESAHYYMNFPYDEKDWSKGHAATENTLFYALLTAKAWKNNPKAYERAQRLQKQIHRYREWPVHFEPAPEEMPHIMDDVENAMKERGATIIKTMDDGSDLDATLMRFNLPGHFHAGVQLEDEPWCQVAQRISRSEDAMCRWEVVSNDRNTCEETNKIIVEIADRYVKKGYAYYGD